MPVDKKYFSRDIEGVALNASPCNLIYTVVVMDDIRNDVST